MRFIKFIFFSFLAFCLITATGLFVFFQTFDTDQYLLEITNKASAAIGRPVSIESMGLGFSPRGITLDVDDVKVADDPAFTKQPFIQIDRVRIGVNVIDLIFYRKIHITNILLQSPQIHFIRNQQGEWNIKGVGQASRVFIVPKPKPNVITAFFPQVIKSKVKPHLGRHLDQLTIQDASISFIDQNEAMPLDIWLNDINANLMGFSLLDPFHLSVSARFYNNTSNVQGSADMSLNLAKRSLQIGNLKLLMDFSKLDTDGLKGISPNFKDNPIVKNIIVGIVQINMAHLNIVPSAPLQAQGDINMTGGMIKNLNIIKLLFTQALGVFGDIEGNIDNLLKGQLKDKLAPDDTIINKLNAQFSIHDNIFSVDETLLQTNVFEFTAKGSLDQGLNMDMQTMLHLNADVSAALINEFGGLQYLMDDSKRIAIDASLKGVIPHLKYKPSKDFRKKSTKALIEEGGNILGVLLGQGQASLQYQNPSSPNSGKKTKNKFKNIFKELLQ